MGPAEVLAEDESGVYYQAILIFQRVL
jgi:hypothetical protein